MMKVKELIEQLSKCNPDADVIFIDYWGNEEYVNIVNDNEATVCLEACK